MVTNEDVRVITPDELLSVPPAGRARLCREIIKGRAVYENRKKSGRIRRKKEKTNNNTFKKPKGLKSILNAFKR